MGEGAFMPCLRCQGKGTVLEDYYRTAVAYPLLYIACAKILEANGHEIGNPSGHRQQR